MDGKRAWGFALTVALAAAPAAADAVPDAMAFHGRLLEPGGAPIASPVFVRFRIFRGGDGTTAPSTGQLVYHESAVVAPGPDGVFSHLVGTGSAAADCVGGTCTLGPAAIGDATEPVWVEVTVDPDGVAGNSDDDRLLPRTRLGTVGYAYRVATLDGIEGGTLEGTLSAEVLEGRSGAVLGDSSGADVALTFDGLAEDVALTWREQAAELELSAPTRFLDGALLPPSRALSFGPFAGPVPGTFARFRTTLAEFADGNLDGQPDTNIVTGTCYNCAPSIGSGPSVSGEYSMKEQWEWTYAPFDGERWVEHNWDFQVVGFPTYRPFGFYLRTDFAGGYAEPTSDWYFNTDRDTTALHINRNGHVTIGGSQQPNHMLEVYGDIHVRGEVIADASQSLTGTLKLLDESNGGGQLVLGSCAQVPALSLTTIAECNVASFSGVGPIETLDACEPGTRGRVLHVLCGSDPTVFCDGDGVRCSGGNLRLTGSAADFVCTPDDVLTLLCDGGRWRQVGVAAN